MHDPAIPLVGMFPRQDENLHPDKNLRPKRQKQPDYHPLMNEQTKCNKHMLEYNSATKRDEPWILKT